MSAEESESGSLYNESLYSESTAKLLSANALECSALMRYELLLVVARADRASPKASSTISYKAFFQHTSSCLSVCRHKLYTIDCRVYRASRRKDAN